MAFSAGSGVRESGSKLWLAVAVAALGCGLVAVRGAERRCPTRSHPVAALEAIEVEPQRVIGTDGCQPRGELHGALIVEVRDLEARMPTLAGVERTEAAHLKQLDEHVLVGLARRCF
ncbi:MAG: hypothetical protein R3B06_18440 [Kofleriaceae bacterium]